MFKMMFGSVGSDCEPPPKKNEPYARVFHEEM